MLKKFKFLMNNIIAKIIFFLILFTSSVFAECKSNNESEIIESLEVEFYKQSQFIEHVSIFYISEKTDNYIKGFNKKKRFDVRVKAKFKNGLSCFYEAEARMHGDLVDHIDFIDGTPISSLSISLKSGNIKNITKFILYRPKSRWHANEIFTTSLFSHLGFLSPRTFNMNVKILNFRGKFIFQEKLKKEFLENNSKIEGPILESKEDFSTPHLKMSKISNEEWIRGNRNNYIISLNAIRDYNLSLLKSYRISTMLAIDELVRLSPEDFDKNEFKKISIFDAIMFAIGGGHGLSYDDRRFYYDPIYSTLEPIYYDGNVTILSKIGYDSKEGKFKKNLKDNQTIKEPFTNIYLNTTRDDRHRRPAVSNSAKNGANFAILEIKKIDLNIFLKELHKNGFKEITIEQLNSLMIDIIDRLELISEAIVYKEKINLEKSLYFKYEKQMNLKENLNLIFINNESSLSNELDILVEECDYSLVLCKSYLINKKKLKKLISQEKLKSKDIVFINFDKDDYSNGTIYKSKNNIKNVFKNITINESFKLLVNKDVNVIIDKKNKIINIEYLSNKGRVVISESKIESWSIQMNNLSVRENVKFNNIHALTSCLTIVDTLLNEVNISAENLNCAESINFIRSSGSLNKIQIKNSFSNEIKASFSQLKLNS